MQVTWGTCSDAGSHSEGLGWGSGLCISNLKSCLKCPGSGLSAGKPLRSTWRFEDSVAWAQQQTHWIRHPGAGPRCLQRVRTRLQDPCSEQAVLKPFILGALDTLDMIQGLFLLLEALLGWVGLQCCVSFRYRAQWFSYNHLHSHIYSYFCFFFLRFFSL